MLLLVSTMTMFAISPVRFGAVGSLNSTYTTINPSSLNGHSYGVFSEIHLLDGLYVCPSLQLSERSHKITQYTGKEIHLYFFDTNKETTIKYFDIPILLKYKFNFNDKTKLFVSAGPTFSNGLKATITKCGEVLAEDLYKEDKFGVGYDIAKSDIGLNAIVGTEINNHYQLSIGYIKGTKDIYGNKDYYPSVKGRSISLSVAYIL